MALEPPDVETGPLVRAALAAVVGPTAAADDELIAGDESASAGRRFRMALAGARERHGRAAPPPMPLRPRFDPRLATALARMHQGERACVMLVHAFRWPVTAVGAVLDLDGTTVRSDANYAVERLASMLADGGRTDHVRTIAELDRYGNWLEDRVGRRLRPASAGDAEVRRPTAGHGLGGPAGNGMAAASSQAWSPVAGARVPNGELTAEVLTPDAPENGQSAGVVFESGVVDNGTRPSSELMRRVVAGVAAVAALAMAVGLYRVVTAPERRTLAWTDEDPTGALLVAPSATSGLAALNGNLEAFTVDPLDPTTPMQIIIAAAPGDDGVYRDAAVVLVNDEGPEAPTGRAVRTANGEAVVEQSADATTVTQVRAGRTIAVQGLRVAESDLIALLDAVVLDEEGNGRLDPDPPIEVLGDAVVGEGPVVVSSRFEIARQFSSDEPIVVETFTLAHDLVPSAATSLDFDRRRLGGADIWHYSGVRTGDPRRALSWQGSPNRVVIVSGDATYDELREVAESLEVVERDVWDVTVRR